MTQNLQIASDPDQQAEIAADPECVQDARSLIDHLSSVLSVDHESAPSPTEDAHPAPEQCQVETRSFANAIMRQSDQIQYLIEQIIRLDSDPEVARLREVVIDLCRALTDVSLRMKQDTSQAAEKIGLLIEAIAIIGGSSDNLDAAQNIASLLPEVKAAAERLVSLERQSCEAGAAILTLEQGVSRSQNKIRDLSSGLIKLNESVEAGHNEIAGLQQRIGSCDRTLAQGLATLGDTIEADRQQIAGLQQRIGSTDRALAQGLATLGDTIEADRQEIAGLQQRIRSADQALAQGLATLGDTIQADRQEIAGLQQRIRSADQALAQGLATLGDTIQADRQEIAGLQQQIRSADQALTQGLAKVSNDIEEGRQEISGFRERIGASDQAFTQALTRLGAAIEADRNEIAGLQQRAGSVDRALAQGLATLGGNIEEGRADIAGVHQRIGSLDQLLGQGLATLNERTTALRDDLGQMTERLASVEDGAALHGVFKDKIEAMSLRLGELERNSTAEIKSWRLHESERNAALIAKLESLEQKNHSLGQGNEQMAARLNAAEQTIANVVQRQKALSSVHDRVVRLLLANPDLEA
jgi:DNA repair exonuclease SbcCD ATPase subunit